LAQDRGRISSELARRIVETVASGINTLTKVQAKLIIENLKTIISPLITFHTLVIAGLFHIQTRPEQ
jgi:hypothetical protein